jgi:hypothetical protein
VVELLKEKQIQEKDCRQTQTAIIVRKQVRTTGPKNTHLMGAQLAHRAINSFRLLISRLTIPDACCLPL